MAEAEDVLQLPIVEVVGGREVKFKRFSMRDLVKWCAEEKAKTIREIRTRHATVPGLTPDAKNAELKVAESRKVTLAQLTAMIDEPEGIEKVLRKSLALSGEAANDEAADKIIERLHWSVQQGMAVTIMSPPPAEEQKAGQLPLAEKGANSENSSSPTGNETPE